MENALLELRTLVMGYNAGIDRAREEITKFLMSVNTLSANPTAAEVLAKTTKIWSRWGSLAVGMSSDNSNIILDVQSYCVQNSEYAPFFGVLIRGLYESDTVTEDDLVDWRSLSAAKGEGTKNEAEKKKWQEVFPKGKAYVDVLEQMESDSEEEDDEDGEEEESD